MNSFSVDFFVENRRRLCSAVSDSYILVTANSVLQSSADNAFPFRQDSNFWYLTGLGEPDFVLAINTSTGQAEIFTPDQNDYQKEWDGTVDGTKIQKTSGITAVFPRSDLGNRIKEAKKKGLEISYLKPLDEIVQPFGFYSNPARRKLEIEIKVFEPKPKDVRLEIARLRQVKQQVEIEAIQRAIDITGDTLGEVKKNLASYKFEKDIERALWAGYFSRGADGHGFDPIVASGKNAATIHYNENTDKIADSELLLLDTGAIVGHYSADISRTWCIGSPSKRQKEIYEAVIGLQNQAIAMLKPGVKLREYQKAIEKLATEKNKDLGIKIERYPHGVSHFLGLDVHDAGDYAAPLVENSILTVEPGIYLADEGIGVRVEDIVRITKNGAEVMSKKISKSL